MKDGLARLTVSSISWFHSIRKCYPSIANCHQCKGWEHWSSGYEGRGFAFQHRILYGHFSRVFDVKNCNVCLRKRPGIALFKKFDTFKDYSLSHRHSRLRGLDRCHHPNDQDHDRVRRRKAENVSSRQSPRQGQQNLATIKMF